MKNKKIVLAVVALVVLVAVMAGLYVLTRPGAVLGPKTIEVQVVHSDGSQKTFTYTTEAKYLGEALYAEGLIIADESNPGMFHTVDGEKADWAVNKSYWSFYIGEEYAMTGVETTPIHHGDVFKLVYTIGE